MFQNKERIGTPQSVSSPEKKAIEYGSIQPALGAQITAKKALQLQPVIGNRNVTQLMKSGKGQQQKQTDGSANWLNQFKSANPVQSQTEISSPVLQMTSGGVSAVEIDDVDMIGKVEEVDPALATTTTSTTSTTTSAVEKPKTTTPSAELSPATSSKKEQSSSFYDYSDDDEDYMNDKDYYIDNTKTAIRDLSSEQLEELKKQGKTKKPFGYKQKLELMVKKGKKDVEELKNKNLGDGILDFNDPAKRKAYAIKRSLLNMTKGGAPDQEFKIGAQNLRISNGPGNFIGDGINKPERDKVTEVTGHIIQHPQGDYKNLITKMQGMGSDPAVIELYRLATGGGENRIKKKGVLSDDELATLMLFYLDENVSDMYKERTSLTEHLQKFAAIASIAEETRSYEAINDKGEATPYSALEIIKYDLRNVSKSIYTLDEVFYKGTKGKESRFPGAPTDGGAEALRYPFSAEHQKKWEEQMRDFSGNKKDFKSELNSVVSNSRLSIPELSPEQIEEQNKKREQALYEMKSNEGKENVQALLKPITELTPKKLNYDQKTFDNYQNVYSNKLNKWESEYSSFSEVMSQIEEAKKLLKSIVIEFNTAIKELTSSTRTSTRTSTRSKPY